MTTSREMVLIGGIVSRLEKAGSWCGETHIQKTAYIAKVMKSVPLESEFILYKHGPYSFDLNKSLVHMLARGVLTLESRGKYGPSYHVNDRLWAALDRISSNLFLEFSDALSLVCDRLARKNVAELERISTAVYVNEKYPNLDGIERVNKLVELKPHVSKELAAAAFGELCILD